MVQISSGKYFNQYVHPSMDMSLLKVKLYILLIIVYMFLKFHDKSIFCICIIPFSPLLILFNYNFFDAVPLQGDGID